MNQNNGNNGNGNGKEQNENRRYIGKVKVQNGQYGNFQKILVDNPNPANQDGSENQYYKGNLIWLDAKTGRKFLVKQISVRNAPQGSQQQGFIASISIDLDDAYQVEDLG